MSKSDFIEQDLALFFSAIALATSLLILSYEVSKQLL